MGLVEWGGGGGERKDFSRRLSTPAPLGSSDTLPRSRSLLQTKMATAPSEHTSLDNRKNRGTVDSVNLK